MGFLLSLLLSFIAGVGLSFTQAPYDLWPLTFPCFGLFYYLYHPVETKKHAFLLSFLFAFGYFIAGFYWIGNAVLIEGYENIGAWLPIVLGLPTLLSLFPTLFLLINHILFKNQELSKFIGFCALLAMSEWVRGHALTGFPWSLYGYGLAGNAPLSQSLSLFGPYGLTLLTVFWGASTGYLFCKKSKSIPLFIVTTLSFGLAYSYGYDRLQKAEITFHDGVEVHILQPNTTLANKWNLDKYIENFEQMLNVTAPRLSPENKHVIIWPETAIPPLLFDTHPVNERIQSMLGSNATLLSGTLTQNLELKYFENSLHLWSEGINKRHIYTKSHLVPFGEYIPLAKYIPFSISTITNFAAFKRGNGPQTVTMQDTPSFSPSICYEIIFPQKVVNPNALRPDYILTITNDAWYGNSPGPHQHFAQGRFRAIEQGIPLVYSANTGVSGLTDAYGNIIQHLPLLVKGHITSKIPKTIPPTIYSQHGDKFFFILLLTLCLALLTLQRKK